MKRHEETRDEDRAAAQAAADFAERTRSAHEALVRSLAAGREKQQAA